MDSAGISPDDTEMASVKWLTMDGARRHIAKTMNVKGQERDKAVLTAGVKFWKKS